LFIIAPFLNLSTAIYDFFEKVFRADESAF